MLITSQTWWRSVHGQDSPKFSTMTSLRDREKMNCGEKRGLSFSSVAREARKAMERHGTILNAQSEATCATAVWPCVHTMPHHWHLPPEPLQSCLSLPAMLRTSADNWTSPPSPGGGPIVTTPRKQHGPKGRCFESRCLLDKLF